jgi:hypothetical protein
MTLRAIKEQARRDLHDAMKVAALYLPEWPVAEEEEPEAIPCNVRIHTKFKALGDLAGTSLSYAETQEPTPKAIFMREEVDPINNAVISVSVDEAYRIAFVHPKDGLTTTVDIVSMSATQRIGLPVPEAA